MSAPAQDRVPVLGDTLDRAPCGFVAFADDGTVLAANLTLADVLGREREELLGASVERILGLGTRIFYQTHLFPLIRMHGSAEEIFVTLTPRDGPEIGALLNARRREHEEGAVTECVLMRVKERRKYEEELLRARRAAEEAQAQLEEAAAELETANEDLVEQAAEAERLRTQAEQANRAKGDFLAVMSHELRTPLNAIAGYVQILEAGIHGPLTDAQLESLSRINRSQRHLLRLINDVLNLSRIDAGALKPSFRQAKASEVLEAVVPLVESLFAEKKVAFEVDVGSDPELWTDPELAEQILVNLLGNAAKFTPAGGTVSFTVAPAADGCVDLRVEDDGIGIPADKVATIFDRFTQVNVSSTRTAEGSGLGLAISRDLATSLGGALLADSVLGEGSVFTLRLPGARPD